MTEIAGASLRRSTLLRVVGTLLAFGLLLYLLSQQGWGEILAAIREIPVWRFALALLSISISRLAISARWYTLLHSAGARISYRKCVRITFAGLFASNFLPTTIGGDVIRLAGAVQLKIDPALSAASLIVDRLVGMTGMAMATPLSLPGVLTAQTMRSIQPTNHSLMISLPIGEWWRKAWRKALRIIHRLIAALALWVKQPRALLVSLLFSWMHMLCLFSIIFLFMNGMGEDISFWLIAGLYSLAYFVTLLPISINGYGLQEISITLIFSSLGGVSVEHSLTSALLFRTLMMMASLPGALFVPGMLSSQEFKPGQANSDDLHRLPPD